MSARTLPILTRWFKYVLELTPTPLHFAYCLTQALRWGAIAKDITVVTKVNSANVVKVTSTRKKAAPAPQPAQKMRGTFPFFLPNDSALPGPGNRTTNGRDLE